MAAKVAQKAKENRVTFKLVRLSQIGFTVAVLALSFGMRYTQCRPKVHATSATPPNLILSLDKALANDI